MQADRRKRTSLQWGLGILAALAAVVIIAWIGGAFSSDDGDTIATQNTIDPSLIATVPIDTAPTNTAVVGSAATDTAPADTAVGAAVDVSTAPGEVVYGTGACPPADGSAEPTQTFADAPAACIDPAKSYTATVVTNKGELMIDLDAAAKPLTVNNFVTLARYHYYDNTPCHRIIAGFMAQCGDPTGTGTGGPGYLLTDELRGDEVYARGTVAMANSGPNSAGSQFFVMVADTPLPPDYTVFGQVAAGNDATLDALEAAADPDAPNGVPPAEDVTIESVTITES